MSLKPLLSALVLAAVPLRNAQAEPLAGTRDVVNYTFDDDLVSGDTLSPTLEILQVRTRGARESLIRVREQFVRELCKSVEQL